MSKQDVAQADQTALLNELIRQQGVLPVADIEGLSDLWPGDDNPDELLEYLVNEREERRRLHPGEKPAP